MDLVSGLLSLLFIIVLCYDDILHSCVCISSIEVFIIPTETSVLNRPKYGGLALNTIDWLVRTLVGCLVIWLDG